MYSILNLAFKLLHLCFCGINLTHKYFNFCSLFCSNELIVGCMQIYFPCLNLAGSLIVIMNVRFYAVNWMNYVKLLVNGKIKFLHEECSTLALLSVLTCCFYINIFFVYIYCSHVIKYKKLHWMNISFCSIKFKVFPEQFYYIFIDICLLLLMYNNSVSDVE